MLLLLTKNQVHSESWRFEIGAKGGVAE